MQTQRSKCVFPTELAYPVGLILLAMGTAFMEMADFGLSMVVAPAYLLHRKLSPLWPFFTFGAAEYVLQFVLLLLMIAVVRRFRVSYLFSAVTAVVYGFLLDGAMAVSAPLVPQTMAARLVIWIGGMLLCSAGISFLMHTYISPEVYELFVKEVAAKWNFTIPRTKTVYDCISCAAAIVLSFCFFGWGQFEGVKAGTVICALLNGWSIGVFSRIFERIWDFRDAWKLRRFFE